MQPWFYRGPRLPLSGGGLKSIQAKCALDHHQNHVQEQEALPWTPASGPHDASFPAPPPSQGARNQVTACPGEGGLEKEELCCSQGTRQTRHGCPVPKLEGRDKVGEPTSLCLKPSQAQKNSPEQMDKFVPSILSTSTDSSVGSPPLLWAMWVPLAPFHEGGN